MFYIIKKTGFISEILGRTRRGEKGWMRTSGIARRYGREDHFEENKFRKYDKYDKMEDKSSGNAIFSSK